MTEREVWGLEERGVAGNVALEAGKASGVYVRKMHFPSKGDAITGHVHAYDHMSVIVAGSVRMEVEGEPAIDVAAVKMIKVEAGKVHKFTALTDNTIVLCVHMLDEPGKRIAWHPKEL